jgi:VWA-like domain (DUF2201)
MPKTARYTPQGLEVTGDWPLGPLSLLDKAYASIAAKLPFMGAIMYNLKHEYAVDPDGTASTDCHSVISWTSGLFERLARGGSQPKAGSTVADLARVATHELLHVVRGDSFFMSDFMAAQTKAKQPVDRPAMNIALDYLVNTYMVETLGVAELSSGVSFRLLSANELDGKHTTEPDKLPFRRCSPGHRNATAAYIYEKLLDRNAKSRGGAGSGSLQEPKGTSTAAGNSRAQAEAKAAHRQLLQAAERQARATKPGTEQAPGVTAGEQHLIDQYVTPGSADATPIDWKRRLKARAAGAIRRGGRSEYTRQGRPSIRGFDQGLQRQTSLPNRLVAEYPLSLVVAVDTSDSIDRKLFGVFVANLQQIRRAYPDSPIDIIYCDSDIQKHVALRDGQQVPASVPHGGGTAFDPVFRFVKRKGIKPSVLVYFTDLEANFPQEAPPYPVLWVAYNTKDKAPFGETIHA